MLTRNPRALKASSCATAVDANQVRHDVAVGLLAAVDQQGHLRAVRRGRRFLRDHGAAGIIRGTHFCEGDDAGPVSAQPELRAALAFR